MVTHKLYEEAKYYVKMQTLHTQFVLHFLGEKKIAKKKRKEKKRKKHKGVSSAGEVAHDKEIMKSKLCLPATTVPVNIECMICPLFPKTKDRKKKRKEKKRKEKNTE